MDKKRIGIFLNCNSDWGGQYQYCLSAVDALSTLPKDQYEILAIYTYDCWQDICTEYGFILCKVPCRTAVLYNRVKEFIIVLGGWLQYFRYSSRYSCFDGCT